MPAARDHRGLRRVAALVAVAAFFAGALPPATQAHAFLIRSDPAAGARLLSAPPQLSLYFTEPYVRGSEHVTVRRADGTEIVLPAPSGDLAVIRQPLPPRLRGIFVVSWRVVSDDGHLSAGEFAFSAGANGALPSVSTSAVPTPWSQVIVSWLFFVGLALGVGGILSELLVWGRERPRAPVAIGVAVAALSSLSLFVLLAGAPANGGFAAGLHGDALRAALATRPGALTLGVLAAVIAAALLVSVGRARVLALVPLAAAAVLTSVRGHAGTSGHWWAPAIDSIHLLAAAAWAGALVHLVLVVVRAPDRAAAGGLAIRRSSRFALPTVLVIVMSGVLNAFGEFRSVGSVFHTSYGQTLVVKTALVLAALAVAAASRVLALPAGAGIKLPLLRRLTLSESALVFAVLAAVGLLVNLAPPRTSAAAAPPVPALRPAERAIPTGPFVVAHEDGELAVGFAARPAGTGRLELTATIIDGAGDGAAGLELSARLRSATESSGPAVPCGPGCYRVTLAFTGTPRVALLAIRRLGHRPSVVRFDFPSRWPPPPAARLVREATRVFSGLHALTIDERLASSPTNVIHTHWRLEAPDRLTYAIRGGSHAIVIGDRRWDREPGGPWIGSPQLPVRQPTPTWASAPGRAALLGSGRVDGRAVWRISFVKPDVPAWFTLAVDKRTLRTLELSMVAPAHFMHHVYGGFDEPPSIRPPR